MCVYDRTGVLYVYVELCMCMCICMNACVYYVNVCIHKCAYKGLKKNRCVRAMRLARILADVYVDADAEMNMEANVDVDRC